MRQCATMENAFVAPFIAARHTPFPPANINDLRGARGWLATMRLKNRLPYTHTHMHAHTHTHAHRRTYVYA